MATVTGGIFAVTGGLSGIGAATSRLLADRGAAFICVGDVSSKNLAQLKNEIKELNPATVVDFTVLDVTSSQQVEQWIQGIVTKYGDLNGAANVAGIGQGAGLRTTPTIIAETDAEWDQVMKVNLDGVFFCTRAEVRAMKDLPRRDRSIVNVSSIAAFLHLPDVYAYGTSKGATAYLTDCVAADAISLGIRVNGVSPGITNTPMLPKFMPSANSFKDIEDSYKREGFSLIQPEDVARTIVWLLSTDSRPVYGANVNVGAGKP
ncbi:short chain dehydrogenase/oxidoreductase CpoX2 [Daldinia decipiens]|uniref:short chain dehydrogenase/oxidoreductase CpoX2 n=1 Tax=Daldinia decipiens TaxID=326647 RepID=UPI0020C24525|nr:short chain dehydrogenase/oxidoreductase CpoX2 [Daldinia decipiens]KAI1658825.1 short chain dehydrogenase/oxidoreductase CpoX2 [Daldinia decipiens]